MKEMLSKSSRVYSVVKSELLDGTIRTGKWIDVPALALRIGVSPTPVKYALFELAGEGLLQAHDRQGFHTQVFDEENLRDLFELRSNLFLMAASKVATDTAGPELSLTVPSRDQIPGAITGFFLDLASFGRRPQLRESIARLDDRLRLVQSAKIDILPDMEEEYRNVAHAWKQRDIGRLVEVVTDACQLRLALIPELIAAMRHTR